jgi:FkbM family methyltransferase
MNLKQSIQNIFFPLGSIQKIRSGYLKGHRIRLTENSNWSPLLGKWEPTMQKIFVNVIRKGQVAYDLGANNGLHGLLMARLVGQDGRVYNFEPLAENIDEIDENFGFNGITNFVNVQAAVSDHEGIAHFALIGHHKQGALATMDKAQTGGVEVKTITLDRFIGEGNLGPDFIKIDIEGAEGDALKGFSGSIGRYRPLMIIELHNPEQDKAVGLFLKEHGYSAHRFDPFGSLRFETVTDFERPHPAPGGVWGTIFCLPPGQQLEQYTFQQ